MNIQRNNRKKMSKHQRTGNESESLNETSELLIGHEKHPMRMKKIPTFISRHNENEIPKSFTKEKKGGSSSRREELSSRSETVFEV